MLALAATVAVLYVDPRGPYGRMVGVDAWDEVRDARRYEGPYAVVAHPPCGPWGRLKHFYKGQEHDCAPRAVEQVRRWGGVLEHPAHSKLWAHCGLPLPGDPPDAFGGVDAQGGPVRLGARGAKANVALPGPGAGGD